MIGVAIVNYNAAWVLRRCLKSLADNAARPVVVIDNGSSDGSAELVRREFPDVDLRVEPNRGYGAGANLAVRLLATPYVLLLNPDTEVAPGTARALASYLEEHPYVAVAGPRLVNGEGVYEPSAHAFPTPISLLVQESGLSRRLGLRRGEWQAGPADWVLGAAVAIRCAAFDAVGGFDEGYVLYQEEVDLCHRLRAVGWETHYAPVATVVHVGGVSTSRREAETFAQFVRSTQRFARLRLSRRRAVGVSVVLAAVLVARIARDTLQLALVRDRVRREKLRRRLARWLSGVSALRDAR